MYIGIKGTNPTQGWRIIGGKEIYCRSKWEANYSRYLQFLKEQGQIIDWQHEPHTFWFEAIKRGVRSYLPDFRVSYLEGTGITHAWHEVKGYYDTKTITKLKRMAKYYPDEKIVLIDSYWFRRNNSKLKGLVQGWE